MTPRTTWTIATALWVIGLVPGAIALMWFGTVEWSWRGFGIACAGLAAIAISYEFVVRWIDRTLQKRRERRRAAGH